MMRNGKGVFETRGADARWLPVGNCRGIVTRSLLRLLLAAVLGFGWSGVVEIRQANGQGLQKIPAPIQVRVVTESDAANIAAGYHFDFSAPQMTEFAVSQGSPVVFVGKTIADGKRKDVKINVKSSAGAKNLVATVDKDGKFSAKFDATQSLGIYSVEAIAPDGAGKYETKFKVVTPMEIMEDAIENLDEATTTTDQVLAAVEDTAGKLPVSPPQKELLEKIRKLKARVSEIPEQIKRFNQAWSKMRPVVDKNPEVQPGFQEVFNQMAAETAELKNKTSGLRQQLNSSKERGALCDDLEKINDLTNGISFVLNLTKKPITTFVNFVIDKGSPKLIERLAKNKGYSDAAIFTATEQFKNSASAISSLYFSGALDPLGTALGLVNDIVQFAAQQAFNSYCEKFEGPVNAAFNAEFDHEGIVWWKYSVTLAGKLTMRFAKTAKTGAAIAFTGQIEGNATSFKLWEDAVAITPRLRRNVIFNQSFAPVAMPPEALFLAEEAGTLARTGTPGYFRIPIEGEIIGEKVTLNILPALDDFSDLAKGRAFYVFVEPILPVPYFSVIEFPIQKAHFILSRGMMEKSEYTIVANKAAKISEIKRPFTRDWKSDKGDIRITWNVDVRACNPKCP